MTAPRPKVLASAYACHPEPTTAHFPGEAVLGWHLAREIAGFADLHLITWAFNREGVEGALAGPDGRQVRVHFVDLPRRLHETLRDDHASLNRPRSVCPRGRGSDRSARR